METIHFTTQINADVQKVWHTMLADATYREWTSVFGNGSSYEGDWNEGSEIRFIAPDEHGNFSGMYSHIKESNKYNNISIEHLGIIKNGEVDTTSDDVKKWAPSFENYTFIDNGDGTTELKVDMDIVQEYKAMFEDLWPKALQKLKEVCEG